MHEVVYGYAFRQVDLFKHTVLADPDSFQADAEHSGHFLITEFQFAQYNKPQLGSRQAGEFFFYTVDIPGMHFFEKRLEINSLLFGKYD